MQAVIRRPPPWYLIAPAAASAAGVALPLFYLCYRAFFSQSQFDVAGLLQAQSLKLLGNTLVLLAGVLVLTTVLAVPAAWLTTATSLPLRRVFAVLLVLPLAVPGYVMAYALRGLGGYDGVVPALLGIRMQPPAGLGWAVLALTLCNFPYMFLNLRAAILQMDPALEENARSLGSSSREVLWRIVLPQLRPAFLAGAMIISLHVIGDFAVVSLMRYETFSARLYVNYIANQTADASRVALVMLLLAAVFMAAEIALLRGITLSSTSARSSRPRRPSRLGWWLVPAMVLVTGIFLLGVVLPTGTVVYWLSKAQLTGETGQHIGRALGHSMLYSLAPAVAATVLALPVAMLRARFPSPASDVAERLPLLGYATPSIAFALSLIFVARHFPWLYQSSALLIYALTLHFLAEAVGPVRSSLYWATPRLEEASRSLGAGRWRTFTRITLPVMRNGIVVSAALVFLSCMKELPLTMLLAPPDTRTLAMLVWSSSEDARFADAAPAALGILLFSAALVGLLLKRQKR